MCNSLDVVVHNNVEWMCVAPPMVVGATQNSMTERRYCEVTVAGAFGWICERNKGSPSVLFVNPWCTCAAKVMVLSLCVCVCVYLSICPSVCRHLFSHYAQQGGQKAVPIGSVPHWLDFYNGDLRESTAFKSYGVKNRQKSQYVNEYSLTSAGLCRFAHCGSYSKVKSWVKVCIQTLPTNTAIR